MPADPREPCSAAAPLGCPRLTGSADHVPVPAGDTAGTPWAELAAVYHSPRSLHGLKERRKSETSEDGAWKGAWSSPQSFNPVPLPLSFRLVVTQVFPKFLQRNDL